MLALEVLAVLVPVLAYALAVRRRPLRATERRWVVASAFAGLLSFLPAWLFEGWVEGWAGLDEHARTMDAAGLVYAFLVAAPVEQSLKLLAVVPAWRARRIDGAGSGVLYASAAGVGFITAHNAELLASGGVVPLDLARVLLAAPAHAFFAASWGFALGRQATKSGPPSMRGRAFEATLFAAMLFNGVYDHIVFARGRVALFATVPVLVAMGVITAVGARTLARAESDGAAGAARARRSIATPTLDEVRAALWRSEEPVRVAWIPIGALVTVGVITSAIVAAVGIGQRIGVDFAAVDRPDAVGSAAPLTLLGVATLGAFPVAGFLVTRASASRSVLEAAVAAGLAIVGVLVLLGLAAPVAVVFAIALAPIALGLACGGAWMGLVAR